LLVVVKVGEEDTWERVEEMRGLCASAGLSVVGEVVQRRKSPASGTYVGKGKLEEIQLEVERTGAKLVVLDRETTPVQLKHLEDALPVEVMDRTGLILDVFARHAHSGEGKLQVELASLRYRLPRLVGKGVELSRLGGRTGARTAMGTRGAGEPWLVEQRRRLRREMKGLEEKIEQLGKRRELARKWRRRNQVPTVGIVGYTNAGKSTLLNSLSASKVVVEDRLFSTLDPTSRAVILPGGRRAIFSDTVGFIRDLPPGLTAAFRATIEEATSADILLHVVDLSSPHWETQRGAVFLILNQLGCAGKPVVTAFNKIDLVSPSPSLKAVCEPEGKGAFVSAKAGKGLEELLRLVEEEIGRFSRENWVRVPYEQLGDAGATGKASRVRYEKDGIQVLVNNPTRVNH
jgi:GTP-binding protein HflX